MEPRQGAIPISAGTVQQPYRACSDIAEAQELAAVYRALGDPTRLRIMALLSAAGQPGLCVCDIVASFSLGQPTISHHLKVLRGAALVTARKNGLWIYYSAAADYLGRLGIRLPANALPFEASDCGDGNLRPGTTAGVMQSQGNTANE